MLFLQVPFCLHSSRWKCLYMFLPPFLMFVEGLKKNIGSDFIFLPWPHIWPQLWSYAVFPNCRVTFFPEGWESWHRKSTCLDMCFSCYLTRFALTHQRIFVSAFHILLFLKCGLLSSHTFGLLSHLVYSLSIPVLFDIAILFSHEYLINCGPFFDIVENEFIERKVSSNIVLFQKYFLFFSAADITLCVDWLLIRHFPFMACICFLFLLS